MGNKLIELGYKLMTNGTDNHLILVDLTSLKITGSKVEKLCEQVGIYINKNTVPTDKSALSPKGIRMDITAAMTTLGFKEKEFEYVALLIDRCIKLCLKMQKKTGYKLKDWLKELNGIDKENNEFNEEYESINNDVKKLLS